MLLTWTLVEKIGDKTHFTITRFHCICLDQIFWTNILLSVLDFAPQVWSYVLKHAHNAHIFPIWFCSTGGPDTW
jgi:hypothetical protein